jgi:predicted ATPase/DNA-binding CsgD family transcriptional regulator
MCSVSSPPAPPVSEREAEVLAAVGEHLSNAQIASRLHLSVRTVETHISSLLRKLGVADRRALAALAPSLAETDGTRVAPVRGLPTMWTAFIGRDRERGKIVAALADSRLVTLLGPGGAGKTRLAADVADRLAPTLPLGSSFVELVSVRPGFVAQAVAAVLGVVERPGRSLRDAVVERLRSGRSLLVLDNCEHLLDDVAEFVSALLGAAAELTVLTTSRERIGVDGERVLPLGGMSLVSGATGGSAGSEAVTLFFDRARALDAGFDADPALVGELCAQLDGMPLAIELATARTATLGMTGLHAGLTDRLRLLSGGRSADSRHRSLRAVLDWSHELLEEDERVALRRLGRFASDFDIPAASAVTGLRTGELADLVGRLGDKSLLVHRRFAGVERWAQLETVRAYAVEKMSAADETEAIDARYADWAVAHAQQIETQLQDPNEHADAWSIEFDHSADDLRAALSVARDDEAAHRLARSLGHLTYARRFLEESRQHYLTASDRAGNGAVAAQDLWDAASVAQVEMRGELRFDLVIAAADQAATAGDHGTQAAVLAEAVSIGTRFPAIFERDVPFERLQELLRVAARVAPAQDAVVHAQLLTAQAWTATRLVDLPDPALFRQAFEAAREADDPAVMSSALDGLGASLLMSGKFTETFRVSEERRSLLARLPGHLPRAGSEIHDVVQMAVENAVNAGELPVAAQTAPILGDETMVATTAHMAASKSIVPLVLMGRFSEAIEHGRLTRSVWQESGEPAARWMAPAVYATALAFGLCGAIEEWEQWRALALGRVAGQQTRAVHFAVGGMARFADSRLALHRGRLDEAVAAVADVPTEPDSWWQERHWYFDAYPWALAAEVAVAAGAPDARARLAAAQPAGEQNLWAAACLARARGRRGDAAALAEAVAGWERIGARFERACTLLLMAGRADEGRAEIAAMGATLPAN